MHSLGPHFVSVSGVFFCLMARSGRTAQCSVRFDCGQLHALKLASDRLRSNLLSASKNICDVIEEESSGWT